MHRCLLLAALLLGCGADDPTRGAGESAAAGRHADEVYGEFASATRLDPGAKPRKGGRIVIALVADVDNFNPYLSTSAYAREVHNPIYPYVLHEQPDFHNGPPHSMKADLVDRWEVTRGGEGPAVQVRMHLRDGANWSDGTPITSHDVEFSLAAAKHRAVAWANSQIVDFIDRVEVIDDKNYVLHYSRDYPYVLKDAKDWRVLPRHVFGKVPFEEWKSQDWSEAARVVSGPYLIESYRHNEEFVLVPNGRYWNRELPRLQKVVVRVIKRKKTMLESLLAGEVDAIDQVEPEDVQKVLDHPDLLLYHFAGLIYAYVGWNCNHAIFQDPLVRRAMTLAIDRKNIVESLLHGYGRLMAVPLVSSQWAVDRSLKPLPFDPAAARRLLAERGWKADGNGRLHKGGRKFEFVLYTAAGRQRRMRAAQLIQADLRRVGVTMRIQQMDFNGLSTYLRENKADAWIGGWWLSSKVDPKTFMHSGGGFNFGRYDNPRVDKLIDEARLEPDRAKAQRLWNEYQAIFHEEQPYSLLWELPMLNAAHRRFQGVRMTALNTYDNLAEWFVSEK